MVALVVTLFSANVLAYTPPPAPASGWYVVDQTGKMSASQIQQLNQKIEQISKSTKNEFGILLLSNMGEDNIEDVANATYKAWGIGKRGLDNGCLIVVAVKERKSRIETGKGVGGEVTDIQANDILRKNLNPHLRSGDFAGGFNDTLGALSTLMESRHNQQAEAPPTVAPVASAAQSTAPPRSTGGCDVSGMGSSNGGFGVVLLLLMTGTIVAIFFVRRASLKRIEELRQEELNAARRRKDRTDQLQALADQALQEREERLSSIPTPFVEVPFFPRASVSPPPSTVRAVPRPTPKVAHLKSAPVATVAVASTAAAIAAEQTRQARAREEEDSRRRQRDAEAAAKRKRDREDDDRRSSSSSSSSSSSWDSGSSSGGGGFGGGDSGGGGSSSDW